MFVRAAAEQTGDKDYVDGVMAQAEGVGKLRTRIEELEAEVRRLRSLAADAQLSLATLCDMVLGEDAEDRSDDALIRAVGTLQRETERLEADNQRLRLHGTVIDEHGEFWWHRAGRAEAEVERLREELDTAVCRVCLQKLIAEAEVTPPSDDWRRDLAEM